MPQQHNERDAQVKWQTEVDMKLERAAEHQGWVESEIEKLRKEIGKLTTGLAVLTSKATIAATVAGGVATFIVGFIKDMLTSK